MEHAAPGEQALTYASYLALDDLLGAQHPRSDEHDELLFIVVHQVYELWFKQLLHELAHAQQLLTEGTTPAALHTLKRVLTILKVAVAQIDVLETMTPRQFTGFRDRLAAASGFQSAQFRELEAVLGRRDPTVLAAAPAGSAAHERVAAAMARPSLFDAFLVYLVAHGYAVPAAALERDVTAATGADARARRRPARRLRRRRRAGAGLRAARRPRRGPAGVALPAREDGRAHDRRQVGHRRVLGRGVPRAAPCSPRCSPTCGRCAGRL